MQKYLSENDLVLKQTLKEINQICHKKKIPTNETLTALLVKLISLDPDRGFLSMTREQCVSAVQQLTELCIKKLSNELSPSLLTIKMQAYFTQHFIPKDRVILEHRQAVTRLTEPLMRELMEKEIKDKEYLDSLYHKLIVIITLLSGLGNPTQRQILLSSSVALSSVLPVNEMPRFLVLGRLDKERQIDELTHVVSGIRIFNHETHQHSEGIEDLPNILIEAGIVMKETLESEKSTVTKSINMLCELLNNCYLEHSSTEYPDEIELVVHIPNKLNMEYVEFYKSLLISKWQMDICIGQLLIEVNGCNEEISSAVETLRARLSYLQEVVRYRTAIPTTYIYPMFMEVSSIWGCLQDQMVLLSTYNNILLNLKSFFNGFDQRTNILESVLSMGLKRTAENSQLGFDTDSKEGITVAIDQYQLQNCTVIYSEDEIVEAEFLGCCTMKLIEGNGLLVPGDPKIGFLSFGMLSYSFSTKALAYKFDKNPDQYLKQLMTIVRRMPELIDILSMSDAVNRFAYMREFQPKDDELSVTANAETQTDVHPVEHYIDRNYSWDIWELRRKAVQLADICKRKTHSTQTHKSHMRMNIGSQTYEGKEVSTQTKVNNDTTMPVLQTYIFGLRGRNDNAAHTVTLTRPHDEWLYKPGARIMEIKKTSPQEIKKQPSIQDDGRISLEFEDTIKL